MIDFKVKRGEAIWFSIDEEIIVARIIADIAQEKDYKIHTFNICKDHIHLIIETSYSKLANNIRLLKGKSAQRYKEHLGFPSDEFFHLWAQKFNKWLIKSEQQYANTMEYIRNNRLKHGLPENVELQRLIEVIVLGGESINNSEIDEK